MHREPRAHPSPGERIARKSMQNGVARDLGQGDSALRKRRTAPLFYRVFALFEDAAIC
jgi:hypothetical protein